MTQHEKTFSVIDFIETNGGDASNPETIQLILQSINDDTNKVFSSLHSFILAFDPTIRHRSIGPCNFEYGMPNPKRWRPLIARLDLTADGISMSITKTTSDPWNLFEPAGPKWKTLRTRVSFPSLSSDLLAYLKHRLSESYTNSTGKAARTTGTLASLINPDPTPQTGATSQDPISDAENEASEDEDYIIIQEDRKSISWDTKNFSIVDIDRRYRQGRIILQPDFQRGYVWNNRIASRFIESVLLKLPLPIVYLSETQDNRYLVIDGQQRLTTVLRFFSNELTLNKLEVFSELNGKRFKDLHPSLQAVFEDYQIITTVLANTCSPDLKFDMFERLNTGSVKLNKQELRNSMYRGNLNQLLKELASLDDFLSLVGWAEPDRRMKGEELILRFFTIYHNNPETIHNFDGALSGYMRENLSPNTEELSRLTRLFKDSLKKCRTTFGERPFRTWKKARGAGENDGQWETRFSSTVYEVLMTSFANYSNELLVPMSDGVREAFVDLMSTDQMFIDSLTYGTNSNEKIAYRNVTWRKRLRDLLGTARPEDRLFSYTFKEQLFKEHRDCAICGQRIHTVDDSAIDHVEHYWRGGKTIPSNARLTHRYCNARRGGEYD